MIRQASRSPLTVVVLLSAFVLIALCGAQTLGQQPAARPDRGAMPGASYSVSDIESVSLTNGNLNLSIPLASLPPIAGGKLKFTLNAVYNSKLWNVTRQEHQLPPLAGCPDWVVSTPQISDLGGWTITGGYRIVMRNAKEDFDYIVPDPPPSQGCETDVAEQQRLQYNYYKTILITPDGAEHELRPHDTNAFYGINGGTRGYLFNYYKDTPNSRNEPLRYYSFDGSFIYAVINPSSYSTLWTIYLNDGTKVTQTNDGVQRITDTNGNSIKISGDGFEDEQTGRKIQVTYDPAGNGGQGQGHVLYQTVTGVWESIDINYGTTFVQGKVYQVDDWNSIGGETGGGMACFHDAILQSQLSVIREIVFPVTEPGQPARKFSFGYNSDTTESATDQVRWGCGSAPESYTRTASHGLGGLSQMTTPTGAVVSYSYSRDGLHKYGFAVSADDIPKESITQKQVTHDGVTDTWTYAIDEVWGGGSVTAPDGSVSAEQCYALGSGTAMFSGDGMGGLVFRSNRSNKEIVERHWVLVPFDAANTGPAGSNSGFVTFNPIVDAEYTSLLDGSGNRVKMAARTYQYDYNGNLLQQTDYDWFDPALVTFGSGGLPTGVPASATVLRTTSNSYHNSATSSGSGNLYAKRILSTAMPLILSALQQTTTGPATAQLSYDGQAYGAAPTIGNLTSKSVWDDVDSHWITTSTTYNSYGNVTSVTDARGKVTYFYYDDSTHAAPTRVVVDPQNGTGTQTVTTAFDFYTGLVTSTRDVNDRISTVDYTNQLLGTIDPFGRPGVTISPLVNAGGVDQQHRTKTFYEDNARTVTVKSDFSSEGDGLLKSQAISDQLGRTIESRQYEGGTNYVVTKTQYDSMGRAFKVSNPYRPWQSETAVWTTSAFDILGRVTSITTPDNAVVGTAYSYDTVTVTDQAGKQRRSVSDALGRLIQVYEDPNGLNYQTSYDYDVFGNLLHVYQGSQTRTFTYDSLSRLRTAANPESATITYTYDDNGNLTNKTDARGIVSTYVYDALNRATNRSYSDSTPAVTYAYDSTTISNGKGRLASVSSNVSTYSYSGYDAMGRVNGGSQTISGQTPQTYSMSYTYDLAGHVLTQTYPSGRVVTNAYDSGGRTSSVAGNLGDGTSRTYATGISYSPFGGIAREQYGTTAPLYHKTFYNIRGQMFDTRVSSVNDTWDWNRGRLIWYYSSNHAWGGSGTDNNGNVMFAENWVPPPNATLDQAQYLFSDSYTYDALNRLSAVNESSLDIAGGGSWISQFVQSYDYDRYGNRTINAGGTWGTGINNKQFTVNTANNRLGVPGGQTGTMSYDNVGNLTTDTYSGSGVTRAYDAENRMISETTYDSVVSGSYSYDGDGRRVKRVLAVGGQQSAVETWQVYGLGGELVAEYASGGSASSPQKEYGYRNGQLLITASVTAGSGGSAFSFTDDPVVVNTTTVKAIHLTELRNAVNQARTHAGLSAATWTDDPAQASVTAIKAVHITELRSRLDEARAALGLSTASYTDPNLTTDYSIKAVHMQELRARTNEAITAGSSSSVDIRWLVSDQLGTPRMIFDQTGSLANVSRHDYLPFGEEIFVGTGGRTTGLGYTNSDAARQKFTSYERDNETGLDYAHARYYGSSLGRFTSPDPMTASAQGGIPQSWNRYSYCLNSPLVLTDPSGLIWGSRRDDKTGITTYEWFQGDKVGEGFTKVTNFYVEGEINGRRVGLTLNPNGPNSFLVTAFRSVSLAAFFSVQSGDYFVKGYSIGPTQAQLHDFSMRGSVDMMPNQAFDVGLTFAGVRGLGSLETASAKAGLSMEGKAYEFGLLSRHLPGTPEAAKLAASPSSAHVFNNLSTLSRVESEIFARGTYTGSRNGFARFGFRFSESIGTRMARDGTTTALDYGEMKLRENGLYHIIPRTGPRQ